MNKTQDLYLKAKKIIPGGTQLLSKRPEQFAPDQWPAYFSKAKGCETWDLDGKHYYDMATNGISACLLGFADETVSEAVINRVKNGCHSSLNPPEEVALAERLIDIHPWAENVRFARTGGEIAAVAVRIARATTGRKVIAVCGYHGWCDWYLAANLGEHASLDGHLLPGLNPIGVPNNLRNTTVTFTYNSKEEFDQVISQHGQDLAAVIMEPTRYYDPEDGFLQYVKDRTNKAGALLIFDEISIGWRLTFGGAHLRYGINPDLAIFAKALGNGHPIAAVIGTKAAMEGAHTSFISSTYWTESVGPTAALAAIDKMERLQVWKIVDSVGGRATEIWQKYGEKYNLPITIGKGHNCFARFDFTEHANELRTLYTALMLKKGFLASIKISTTVAHDEKILEKYDTAIDEVFAQIKAIIEKDTILESIGGRPADIGFKRLL